MKPRNGGTLCLDGLAIKTATAGPGKFTVTIDGLAGACKLRHFIVGPPRQRIIEMGGDIGDVRVLLKVVQFPVQSGGIGKVARIHDHGSKYVAPNVHHVVLGERLELGREVGVA